MRAFIIRFAPEMNAGRDHFREEKEGFISMNSTIDMKTMEQAVYHAPLRLARQIYESAAYHLGEGHVGLAESLFRRALYMFEKYGESARYDAVVVMINLGMIKEDRCEFEAAEHMYHRAIMALDRSANNDDVNLARLRLQLWWRLGRINRVQGRHDRAEAFDRLASEMALT